MVSLSHLGGTAQQEGEGKTLTQVLTPPPKPRPGLEAVMSSLLHLSLVSVSSSAVWRMSLCPGGWRLSQPVALTGGCTPAADLRFPGLPVGSYPGQLPAYHGCHPRHLWHRAISVPVPHPGMSLSLVLPLQTKLFPTHKAPEDTNTQPP